MTGKLYPSCLSCHSHPIRPCGAPFPRGEGCDTRIPSSKKRQHTTLVNLSAPQVPSSRAKPRDLYCTAAICTHAPSLKRHLGAFFFTFPSPTVYQSSLYFGPHDTQERRIVSYRFIPLRRVVPLRVSKGLLAGDCLTLAFIP